MMTYQDDPKLVKRNTKPMSNQATDGKDSAATHQTPSESEQKADQGTANQRESFPDQKESLPYGMIVALAALTLMSLVAFSALVIFRDLFENATEVSTMLGSLFAVVGTVVGAYFGVKASGDTRDKMQGTIERSNEIANRALAELNRESSRRVVRDTDESAQ